MFKKLLTPTFAKRVIFFIFCDVVLSIFTIYLAYLLRFNFDIPVEFFKSMKLMMAVVIPLKVLVFYIYKIYFIPWRFFGLNDYKKLVYSHLLVYTVFSIIFLLFQNLFLPFPRSVILIDLFLSLFFIGFLRISRRVFIEGKHKENSKKALMYGSNSEIIKTIKSFLDGEIDYEPIAIISRDNKSVGTYLSGIKVYAKKDMKKIIREKEIESAIVCSVEDAKELDGFVDELHSLGVKDIKISQIFQEDKARLKNITLEDLLARKPKDLDKRAIKEFIKDKKILITGAGGSIGRELSRQCLRYGAKKLYLLDHSEYNLYKIEQELEKEAIVPILQSVVDKKILEKTFEKYDIDIVLHAAAYKHVPLVEENVDEAILNNIVGTKNCIDLSIKYGVKKFILISTDKAVRPANVMGATKRVCELYAQNIDSKDTEIVAVRFGNVLGSSGSVVPKFRKQIEEGGPITVTHPEITRYFMLIPEACELVLQAASMGRGGEVFVLDMGEPVKIVDLAKKMRELSGKKDIKIEFIGLRSGEKLYEELLVDESDKQTKYSSIFVAKETKYDIERLKQDIEELLLEKNKIDKLKKIVPEFKHD